MQKSKPEEIKKIVNRTMEAVNKNIDEEKWRKEEGEITIGRKIVERTHRLKESGLINAIPNEAAAKIIFDQLDDRKSLTKTKKWLDIKDVPFIFLSGPTNVGKTIAGAWVIANYGGMYLSATALERAGRAVYGLHAERFSDALIEPLLFIDDLGTERDEKNFSSTIRELINSRQGGRLRTIFSTNLNRGRIYDRYFGEREVRRLLEHSVYIVDDSGKEGVD